MATSLFSQRLAVNIGADGNQEVERVIDAELQEVRDVLYQLILRPMPDGSYCWCHKSVTAPSHATRCERARALWAKLQIEESNQIQEQEKSNV